MIGWATAAALALAALPALREARRKPVTALSRDHAPGAFATLSNGKTHYQWFGPEHGTVAVCVHGLTTPSFVWLGLVRHLADAGYRVLLYDLYGRGFSDAPRSLQTPAFFSRQLTDLLDDQNIGDDITLLGYSMGGVISAAWAAGNPRRLKRLILLAPAGMQLELGPVANWCVATPVLGDWTFHMAYPRLFRRGVEAERHLESSVPEVSDQQLSQLERRGFIRSVLSSLRGSLRHPTQDTHRRLAATGLPVTAIWGREDRVIPLASKDHLTAWNRAVAHVVIDGAGHGLPYTHTAEVARAVLARIDA